MWKSFVWLFWHIRNNIDWQGFNSFRLSQDSDLPQEAFKPWNLSLVTRKMYNHKTNDLYQNKFQYYFIVLECIWQYKLLNRRIYTSSIWNQTHIYITIPKHFIKTQHWIDCTKKTAQKFIMWNVLTWYHISLKTTCTEIFNFFKEKTNRFFIF